MKTHYFFAVMVLNILTSASLYAGQPASSAEVLQVKHYNGLGESLKPSVASKIANTRTDVGSYQSRYAKNNGDPSLKNKKDTVSGNLATTANENAYSTNSSSLAGPAARNTTYELLSSETGKEYFSEVAFLDSSTAVTIAYSGKQAWLLLVDISSQPMKVNSRLSVPVTFCCHSDLPRSKEKFYVDAVTKKIILPVNKTAESTDRSGNLSWKHSKKASPGIWIITPVKNDEKKWVLDRSNIGVNYFSKEGLPEKGKNAFRINTAHADKSGNIWMSFTDGLVGVLKLNNDRSYGDEVSLYNFNKDAALYLEMKNSYKAILYDALKGSVAEAGDTIHLKDGIERHPQAYGQQYMEAARFRLYSNLLKVKNAALDSNTYYENPESLWKYIHIELDNPLDKKKEKLCNYSGFLVHPFQSVQNSITSGSDNSVFITTNLGLYKLVYDPKTNSITNVWSEIYKNSFIRKQAQKTAGSGSTPTYIEDRNEVVICDNDFPQVNMLILDAGTGKLKQQFTLFEKGYGSACENAIAYSHNTLIAGNTFGYGCELKDKDDIPASGIMKFYCEPNGIWRVGYDWNKLQYLNTSNTAAPKISSGGERVYIYHQPDETKEWQVSCISLNKVNSSNPILFSLQPDFKGVVKADLNNYMSNFTFGPKNSLFVGTSSGLLKVVSE